MILTAINASLNARIWDVPTLLRIEARFDKNAECSNLQVDAKVFACGKLSHFLKIWIMHSVGKERREAIVKA